MLDAIIVSFNSGQSLVGCCKSLLRQSAVACIRVADNTPGGADAELLAASGLGERVVVVANGENRGFGPAVNSVLTQVQTAYVAIVNPDGFVDDGALDRLVQALEREPDAVLAGARLLGHDGLEQRGSRRREPTPRRLIGNTFVRVLRLRRWYRLGFEMNDAPLPDGPTFVDAVSGACMVARTAALRAIGGFDERFFLHFEDLDLCKRLREAGGKILFIPDVAFCHEGGGSSASRPYFVIWHKHRSMVRYYWKHYRRVAHGGLWLPLVALVAMLRCAMLMTRQMLAR